MAKLPSITRKNSKQFMICCKALAKAISDDRDSIEAVLLGGISHFKGTVTENETILEAVLGRKYGKIKLTLNKELNNG